MAEFDKILRNIQDEGRKFVSYKKRVTIIGYNYAYLFTFSYYIRDAKGKLKNTPYVDNSYKWAGGGFLSTVGDLVKIGNVMLYSSQYEDKTAGRRGNLLAYPTLYALGLFLCFTKTKVIHKVLR